MHYDLLISLAEQLSSHLDLSEQTLSNKAVGHARLFSRLRSGKGCTVATYHRVVAWFDANWPEDVAWPSDLPRPSTQQTSQECVA